MNRTIISSTVALVLSSASCISDETIHKDWIEGDRSFAAEVKAVLRKEPQRADRVLFWFPVEKRNLGFGYALIDRYGGKGYLGFWSQMLYFNNKLVSLRVTPSVGMEIGLTATYAEMLQDVFPLKADGTFEPFDYNPEAAIAALPGCEVKPTMDAKMQFFCSPFSGVRYGTIGGYAGTYLQNRRAYLQVADEIDGERCLRLLYSINPATRLTAYEHYRQHQAGMSAIVGQVEARMRAVFKEVPRIETMRGCIFMQEDSRKVVESILQNGDASNLGVEPEGAANRNQPVRSETNRDPRAAGSGR